MLAQTRVKLRNAESSLAFMQEQHARTLEGLHSEIQKLQKKNAKLSFHLAMQGSPDSASSDQGSSASRQLEEQLSASTAEVLELRTSLSSHKEKVSLLEHKVSELEEKLSEEGKHRDARMAELNTELESKSNTIAYLTQQLRQAKLKLKTALEENGRLSHLQSTSTTTLPEGRLDATAPRACRTFRRTTSSPLPQDTANFQTHLNSGNSRHVSPPTPPPTLIPRPPSTGTPSHPLLQQRASNKVRRRWSHSPKSSETSSTAGLHSPHPPPSLSPSASNKSLGPVSIYGPPTTPPDISDILRHNHETRDSQLVVKRSPPVLPPIQSETSVLCQQRGGEASVVDSRSRVLMLSQSTNYIHPPELSRPQLPLRHRHLILAQAQGLSSAPSALRVLRYNSLSRGRLEGGRGELGVEEEEEEEEEEEGEGEGEEDSEEEEEEDMIEGRLMVCESINRKDQAWQELHQHGAD